MKPYAVSMIGLENRHCIVLGGGPDVEEQVGKLLACEATVTVIGADLTRKLRQWADNGRFTWIHRAYLPGDLRGAFLVIAEHADAETNAMIFAEAEAEKALVQVIDDVAHCSFLSITDTILP